MFEQVPLPVRAGTTLLVRFNFSGFEFSRDQPLQDLGWWIDDVYLGSAANPTRYLIRDFEGQDASRWDGLLTRFDMGIGFTVVEETARFPRAYFFELHGNNAHDISTFQRIQRRVVNDHEVYAEYAYEPGLVGYFADHYATYWAGAHFPVGSATHRPVPLRRLKKEAISYPYGPQYSALGIWDASVLLSLALDPTSGLTLDDLAYFLAFPAEQSLDLVSQGLPYVVFGRYPDPPAVSILDASPTYRPGDIVPASPWTPFPERPVLQWPFVLGPAGGWPKSVRHGALGDQDPTTTTILGQPFLARDAAFHPDRNPVFDDAVDYRGLFATEFVAAHAGPTHAAFAGLVPAERVTHVPRSIGGISTFDRIFCYQTPAGGCGPEAQAMMRPWIEEVIYQRMRRTVFAAVFQGCPAEPADVSPASAPQWVAFNACLTWAIDTSHTLGTELLTRARNLGAHPTYAFLNAWGPNGIVNPELWTQYYLYYWNKAKAPAALPQHGVTVTVEQISRHGTPVATVRVRQADTPARRPQPWRMTRR